VSYGICGSTETTQNCTDIGSSEQGKTYCWRSQPSDKIGINLNFRGYKPVDNDTRNYIIEKAKEVAKGWSDHDCKIMLTKGVMGGKTDSITKLKMFSFRDCVKEDMGQAFYDTYFLKHEPA
jgi:hypothetical protein